MSEQCYQHPERTRANFPEHEYEETDPGRFNCRFCKVPRGDMTCYCALYVVGHVAKHTVDDHTDCGGHAAWNGPCGGCNSCLSLQVTYGMEDYDLKWMETEEARLYAEELTELKKS